MGTFTHISSSFRRILGYAPENIVDEENFSFKFVHPHDKWILNDFLNSPAPDLAMFEFDPEFLQVKHSKFRAKHIKDYWKYFIIFSIDYWNIASQTFDKIGVIADEHAKQNVRPSPFTDEISIHHSLVEKPDPNFGSSMKEDVLISPREYEILEFLSEGMIAKEIALKLGISLNTVITHRKNLIEKLAVRNTAELIRKSTKLMLI